MRSTPIPRETLAVGLVLFGVVAFSINAGVSRIALDSGISAAVLSGVRAVGSASLLGLAVLLFRRSQWRIPKQDHGVLLIYGLVGVGIMPLFYFEAISRIPIGLALLLEFLAPVWVALWARIVRRQEVNRLLWPAVSLPVVGLAVIAGAGLGDLDPVGILAGIACSFAFATYFIFGERLVSRSDPIAVTFWGFSISGILWTVVGLTGFASAWWSISLTDDAQTPEAVGGLVVPLGLVLLWVVALGTVIPFSAETTAMKFIPAIYVSIIATAEPVGSAVVAWWLFDQTLEAGQIIGGLIVVSGIVLALLSRPGHQLPATVE